jgi:hypothetical protein
MGHFLLELGCYFDAVSHMICSGNFTKEQMQRALEARDGKPYVIIPEGQARPLLVKADSYVIYRGNAFLPSCTEASQSAYTLRHAARFVLNTKQFLAELSRNCRVK